MSWESISIVSFPPLKMNELQSCQGAQRDQREENNEGRQAEGTQQASALGVKGKHWLLGKSFPLLHPVLTAHRKRGTRSNRKIKSLPSVFNKQIREVEGNLFQTGNHACWTEAGAECMPVWTWWSWGGRKASPELCCGSSWNIRQQTQLSDYKCFEVLRRLPRVQESRLYSTKTVMVFKKSPSSV